MNQVAAADEDAGLVTQLGAGLVDLDDTVVGELLEEAEEGDLLGAEAWRGIVGSDFVDDHRRGREGGQEEALPEALAALQA